MKHILVFIVALIFVLSNLLNIFVTKITLNAGHQIGANLEIYILKNII